MIVVIKYTQKWALYPHPYGGKIINIAHTTDVIDYPEIDLDSLTNDMRSAFIYNIQRMYNFGDDNILKLESICLFKNKSEVK